MDKLGEGHLLLHFGAVDERCEVFVNGIHAGEHRGGYLGFSVDITKHVFAGMNDLHVVVEDDSDTSYHARGKQKLAPGGMYYTAQSGIWQTVWMEYVPKRYITEIIWRPDLAGERIGVTVCVNRLQEEADKKGADQKETERTDVMRAKVKLIPGGEYEIPCGEETFLPVSELHLWSPEDPFLYDAQVTLLRTESAEQLCEQPESDCAMSYFGMRSFGIGKDRNGITRFMLNGKPYFQSGVLDQGYWPEGLLTAPSDKAMIRDIKRMKKLGFNMLRKHVKIESMRWYYHCDRLGMLVWQDMVNGGETYKDGFVTQMPNLVTLTQKKIRDDREQDYRMLSRGNADGRAEYEEQLREMIHQLKSVVSICTWVPFNEGWGQFDSARITEMVRELDDTRLVDSASGWFDQGAGNYDSIHNYFRKLKVKKSERVVALTEFGGYSRMMSGYDRKNGMAAYRKFDSEEALTRAYEKLIRRDVLRTIPSGLCVSIYTQLSDIEEEINGLYTYDRKTCKMDGRVVRRLNLLAQKRFLKCTEEE